jgi:uncharacterized membrane protein YfcA
MERSYSPVHLVTGAVMITLGGVGLSSYWDALGMVARGGLPFGLLTTGMVIAGAGVRAMRESRGVGPSIKAITPVCAVLGCLVLIAAAASGVELGAVVPKTWTPTLVAGYLALGLVSGIVGGMLGLGGGLVHLSGLTLLFGMPFGFARGATLINNVFLNASAALRYGRRGMLLWSVVPLIVPAAVLGVVGGSLLQSTFDEELMRQTFAVFVLLITVALAVDTIRPPTVALVPTTNLDPVRHGVTGATAGLVSGILGISGGVVAVPGQTLVGGVPLRQAIANSTFLTAVSSTIGSIMLFWPTPCPAMSAAEMTTVALLFVPGNLIGGHFGALWMERLPVLYVRIFFLVALVAIAARSWGVWPG